MDSSSRESARTRLRPIDRVSEALFGLIMVMTFTGSLSIAEAGREDVRTMLIGALGCNLAWGIIDGILYLMSALAEKSEGLMTLQAVREARDAADGRRLVAEALPPVVSSILTTDELDMLRLRLRELPTPSAQAHIEPAMWLGALRVFLWVFLITFPVAIPFIVMQDARFALRVSNGIAIGLLFVAGVAYGRITGRRSWAMGLAMVMIGLVLSGLTMALGG
jgi:VIT1/CCC1 family predicted Fe2+/Mn2+ transporter